MAGNSHEEHVKWHRSTPPTQPTHTHTHTLTLFSPPRDIFAQALGSMHPKKRRAYPPSGMVDVPRTVVQEHEVFAHPRARDSGGMACRCLLPSCRFCGPCSSQGHRMVDEALVVSRVDTSRCACCMPGCRHCTPAAVSTGALFLRTPRRKQGEKRPLSQELAVDSGEDSGPETLLRALRRPANKKNSKRGRER